MAVKINKLTKLKNPESFLQLDTVKGFKYIDKAGELVNLYVTNNKPPKFQMDLSGLIVDNPTKKISQLKVSPDMVWSNFKEISSLDEISLSFLNEVTPILDILEITQLKRIGWRNYFIYEFKNFDERDKYFKALNKLNPNKSEVTSLSLRILSSSDLKGNLLIQAVKKNEDFSKVAVLFDVDIFLEGVFDVSDLKSKLTTIRQYLTSEEGLLALINDSFK